MVGLSAPLNNDFYAAVKAANARGGIMGHPIDAITCDSQSNNNGAAACGQQAVQDHVFAVIAAAGEDTYFPYLQKAGIPGSMEGHGPGQHQPGVICHEQRLP